MLLSVNYICPYKILNIFIYEVSHWFESIGRQCGYTVGALSNAFKSGLYVPASSEMSIALDMCNVVPPPPL